MRPSGSASRAGKGAGVVTGGRERRMRKQGYCRVEALGSTALIGSYGAFSAPSVSLHTWAPRASLQSSWVAVMEEHGVWLGEDVGQQ